MTARFSVGNYYRVSDDLVVCHVAEAGVCPVAYAAAGPDIDSAKLRAAELAGLLNSPVRLTFGFVHPAHRPSPRPAGPRA